jgi:hypothetical protein
MSDETPRDEWLTSASRDPEEMRRADELELFLVAALTQVSAADSTRLSDTDATLLTSPHDARASDERLATMLVEVGKEIVPDADFVADLQAQIERRIRERGREGADGTDGTDGTGETGETGTDDVSTGGNGDRTGSQRGRATRLRANWRRYRPLWAALAALLLLTVLVALPPVQATLRRTLCLGSVCIVWGGSPHSTAGSQVSPTSTPLTSLLDLAGRTTLVQARAQAGFPVRLPLYPANLGPPDYVFSQNLDGAAVVLVWVDHAHPDRVRLSLSALSSGIYVYKFVTQPVEVTTVHGQQAFWTTGPYMVELQDGTYDTRRFVTGHALVWTEGTITYRLETTVSLDEAVRIAESLR